MFRRIIYELHLWLGIITGIILFIVCATGAMLVFREDIKTLLFPESFGVNVPKDTVSLPPEELIAKIEEQNKDKVITMITLPESKTKPVSIILSPKQQGEGRQRSEGYPGGREGQGGERRRENRREGGRSSEGTEVPPSERNSGHGRGFGEMQLINPYTAEPLPKADSESFDRFFMNIMMLHRNLLINIPVPALGQRASVGKYIVGIATIVYVVISITGLLLWIPKIKARRNWKVWKIGLGIRFRSGFWRFIYDLHNTAGFYTLIPMLILALTGLCWSFAWYRDGTSWLLGDQIFKQRMQKPAVIEMPDESMKPLPIAELIKLQKELTPHCGNLSVSLPQARDAAVIIQTGKSGFFSLNVKDKTQWDAYRGKVIEDEKFADKPLGTKIAALVRPLHLGDVTGMSSKIFFFAVCLLAATFPLTGVMLWVHKLVVKRKAKKIRDTASLDIAAGI